MSLDKLLQDTMEIMGKHDGQLKVPTDMKGHADPKWLLQLVVSLKTENMFMKSQLFVLYTLSNKLFETLDDDNKETLSAELSKNLEELDVAFKESKKPKLQLAKPTSGIISP